jgi:4-hydroxybenzoate polyprenyltransferase
MGIEPGDLSQPETQGRPARWSVDPLIDLARLTRLMNCVAAGAATLLGAYLTVGPVAFAPGRHGVRAGLTVALIVAASNIVNDREDVRVDALSKPGRPLASERFSIRTAGYWAVVLCLAGWALSATLGSVLATLAMVLTVLAFAYSYRLKNTILLGNGAVAFLAGMTVPYGALAVGKVQMSTGVASVLVYLFMFAFEVLKTIEDREADMRAGLRTVATRFGTRASLYVFQTLAFILGVVAVLSWLAGLASGGFLAAVLVGSIFPTMVIAAVLGGGVTDASIRLSVRLMKAAWFSGLAALFLLR